MSEHKPRKSVEPKQPRAFGWMAEYVDEHSLLEAARKVRDSGYTKTDAFTPFPVHGIDEALGIKPTVLPFIVLCAGITGLSTALLLQWWTNGYDYPYIISGKPFGLSPAAIPVSFELTVLFSAFTSFLGMIALNRLPKFSNPVFTNPRFDRATNDRFFLYVDSSDKYYNRESVRDLLSGTHPESLDEVMEDSSPSALPRPIWLGALFIVLTGLIPGMVVLNMRASTSDLPRLHVFFDMDFQPKKKAQQTTTLFADGRIMRPQVKGTVARGQYDQADAFYLGYDPDKVTMNEIDGVTYVAMQDAQPPTETQGEAAPPAGESAQPPESKPEEQKPAETKPEEPKSEETKSEPASNETAAKPAPTQDPEPAKAPEPQPEKAPQAPADAASQGPKLPWIDKLPIEANEANMALGRKKFEINCAPCHGYAGYGDGLVHKRADALAQGYWLPPTSFHIERVRSQPVGQIFHTITKGQGKMASYAASLTPEERWAVVLYVKALQRSRNATIDDVPVDQRSKLDASK